MSRFLNPELAKIEAYIPGEQPRDMKYIKLNTNESPYPPSPSVLYAANEEEIKKLRLYSDPESKELKNALAALYALSPKNICVSNGSDEILNFAFLAFGKNKSGSGAVFPKITYGFYPVFANLYGIEAERIPLRDNFSINPDDYINKNKLTVIANPNAPTGISLTKEEIRKIVSSNPDGVVVIDEAYVDFGGETCYELIKEYDNLLVVRTFSKSRSMAGARLGFAFASEAIIEDLEKIRYSTNPYNVNCLTQLLGIKALEENDYYIKNCEKIIKTRGGQYMSNEAETQYNPQCGERRTIFSDEYDFLTKIESVCAKEDGIHFLVRTWKDRIATVRITFLTPSVFRFVMVPEMTAKSH
ncbi:MAG: histidinol-phosphate transaminase, partial [Clostridiales bacterium]|nr:histidinol-phosphate transaminase [Clostridiales bacterium]